MKNIILAACVIPVIAYLMIRNKPYTTGKKIANGVIMTTGLWLLLYIAYLFLIVISGAISD